MVSKAPKIVFILLFLAMLVLPLATANFKENTVSTAENRTLANMAKLYDENGVPNHDFCSDFEAWVNDHIGFRSLFVRSNARIQYYLFHVLTNNSDWYLGPNGELNYATSDMFKDYQHLNIKPDEQLRRIAEGFQYANAYLKEKGIQLYYFQCWDKHSIYPEYFPSTVLQYGSESMTDGVIQTLAEKTDVVLISPKQAFIAAKGEYETYSIWGDATHWTQRGAFIGYQLLMRTINEYNGNIYKILQEDDYTITLQDMGSTLFGGIHEECMLEDFQIINPQAYLTNEKLTFLSDDKRHSFYTNDSVHNDTRILILGDSYFNLFILDDIAESFHETLMLWGHHTSDFENIIAAYRPDIVVVENAERGDRFLTFANTLFQIRVEESME